MQDKVNNKDNELNIINLDINNKNQEINDHNENIKKLNKQIEDFESWNNDYEKRLKLYDSFSNDYNDFGYRYLLTSTSEQKINFDSLNIIATLDNIMSYYFEDEDSGTKAIIRRMWIALRNVEWGYYKNPEFYLGIKDVEKLNIIINNDLDNEIIDKYKLNKNQIDAVEKSINTDSVFYLQGPPGTGKTQTICAISEWIINNNMSLVVTSSTHEAINNFFDRFSDFNKKNPNLIALKFRNTQTEKDDKLKDEQKHDSTSLYKNFKTRMKNNVIVENDENQLQELEHHFKKFNSNHINDIVEIYIKNKFIPLPIVKQIFKYWESSFKNQFINSQDAEELWKPISYDLKNENDFRRYELAWERFISSKNKDMNEFIEFNKLLELHINLFIDVYGSIDEFKFDMNYFNKINDFIKQNKKVNEGNDLKSLIKSINEKYRDKEENESEFLNYIIDNELINVIGVTTTSENKIKLNGKDIFLYNEYPIDYMIVDEISKCSTPEILSKAVLAKKVLFIGDYLQLPPSSNLSNDKIVNHLKSNKWKDLNDNDLIKKSIEELFKTSFFKIQVQRIKESNLSNFDKPYSFLNESHRFGSKIMEIVNVIYPNDEKLKIPSNSLNENKTKINLFINNKNLDSEAVLVNILKPTKEFWELHNKVLDWNEINDKGFDQSGGKLLSSNKTIKSDGTYNEYSVHVIVKIVNKLLETNRNFFNDSKRIGIITLTRSQKDLIWFYLKRAGINSKNIKVDTIDNFQGREEEVIIVDFIRGLTKIEDNKVKKIKGKRNTSFLSEKERINVAVSRAKSKLILVGHFKYLKTLKSEGFEYLSKYYDILKSSADSYIEWIDECEGD